MSGFFQRLFGRNSTVTETPDEAPTTQYRILMDAMGNLFKITFPTTYDKSALGTITEIKPHRVTLLTHTWLTKAKWDTLCDLPRDVSSMSDWQRVLCEGVFDGCIPLVHDHEDGLITIDLHPASQIILAMPLLDIPFGDLKEAVEAWTYSKRWEWVFPDINVEGSDQVWQVEVRRYKSGGYDMCINARAERGLPTVKIMTLTMEPKMLLAYREFLLHEYQKGKVIPMVVFLRWLAEKGYLVELRPGPRGMNLYRATFAAEDGGLETGVGAMTQPEAEGITLAVGNLQAKIKAEKEAVEKKSSEVPPRPPSEPNPVFSEELNCIQYKCRIFRSIFDPVYGKGARAFIDPSYSTDLTSGVCFGPESYGDDCAAWLRDTLWWHLGLADELGLTLPDFDNWTEPTDVLPDTRGLKAACNELRDYIILLDYHNDLRYGYAPPTLQRCRNQLLVSWKYFLRVVAEIYPNVLEEWDKAITTRISNAGALYPKFQLAEYQKRIADIQR